MKVPEQTVKIRVSDAKEPSLIKKTITINE